MLYEVITLSDLLIFFTDKFLVFFGCLFYCNTCCFTYCVVFVITSYSIHYTKLYDSFTPNQFITDFFKTFTLGVFRNISKNTKLVAGYKMNFHNEEYTNSLRRSNSFFLQYEVRNNFV